MDRNPDVMYHPGPVIDRDVVIAVVQHGPLTNVDIWNIVRDRHPWATPAMVLLVCRILVGQQALGELGGNVFTSVRS